MKANELMLNDFVRDKHGNICIMMSVDNTISSVTFKTIGGITLVMTVELYPITLTAEILEKNGFQEEHPNSSMYRLNLDNDIVVRVGLYEPYHINISEEHYYTSEDMSGCDLLTLLRPNAKCLYVHELQHALRLCGFNEMADNFKI